MTGVTALALLILVVGIAVVLGHAAPRSLGSNQVPLGADAVVLEGHERACQAQVAAPAGTGRIELHARRLQAVAPPLTLSLIDDKRVVRRVTVPGGWNDGGLRVRFPALGSELTQPSLCVRVAGPQRVALEGYGNSVRVDYLTARPESWWSRIGLLNDRFPQGKSTWYGAWSLGIAFALILVATIAAVLTVARRQR